MPQSAARARVGNHAGFVRYCAGLLWAGRVESALVLGAALTSAVAFGYADPMFQRTFFDSLAHHNLRVFAIVAVLLILFYTLVRLATYGSALALQRLKNTIARTLTARATGVFFDLAYTAVSARERGYFVANIYDEPTSFSNELVDTVSRLATASATLLIAATVCVLLAWKVAVVLVGAIPLAWWLSRGYADRQATATREEAEREAQLREGLGRAVDSFKTVRLFALLDFVTARLGSLHGRLLSSRSLGASYSARYQATAGIVLSYAELGVLCGAAIEVLSGALSIGGLLAFMAAYWRTVQSVEGITSQAPSIGKLRGWFGRAQTFSALPRQPAAADAKDEIQLRNARFSYPNGIAGPAVTVDLRRGARLLITGPNGSGKSTLAHGLVGLLPPKHGTASLPGPGVTSALLLPFHFAPGSVRENLGLDEQPEETRRECVEMLRRFGLAGYLDRDPLVLSQGEQRKLQVAMALSKDANLYVLDEPLSNIDTDSKAAIMGEILRRTRYRSLVLIMHGEEDLAVAFDSRLDLGSEG